ncbi:MAG: pilus assembly protein [Planctomycetes bacterium]|nr:pilus assembly protein [Planctomycetota bacterium]
MRILLQAKLEQRSPEGGGEMKHYGKQDKRRGTALVEMAVVLPVFLMVVWGIIEFGRGMMVANMVTNAAREGARLAVIDGNTNTDVQNSITSFLQQAINVSPGEITVTIGIDEAPGNPDSLNILANASPRDLVNIVVSVPFDSVSFIPGDYLSGKSLVGRASMRHE